MTSRTRTTGRAVATTLCALTLAGATVGCRGDRSNEPPRQFFPSLDDQPKYQAQSKHEFFGDERSEPGPPDEFIWTPPKVSGDSKKK